MEKRKKNILILSLLLFIFLGVVIGFVLPVFFLQADKESMIYIPVDADKEMLKDSLSSKFGSRFAGSVMTVIGIKNPDLSKRHGAYLVRKGMSPFQAARILSGGGQTPIKLTINGQRTLKDLADRISSRMGFSSEDMLKALNDSSLMSAYGLSTDQAQALFINDTYEFYWSASPEDVINKIGKHYFSVWNKERKEKASKLGLSPIEIMTVASIVDEESNAKEEKGIIGRLYINRLKKGMRLQADPTVRFAANDFTIRRITRKHLEIKSPYNTYIVNGLPPGPIRTTSVTTIDAILNSQPSEYLYMCAKEDFSGRHNFSSSYSEHLANARRYQKALNDRNIH